MLISHIHCQKKGNIIINTSFKITPYHSSNFIYEGSTPEQVDISHKRNLDRAFRWIYVLEGSTFLILGSAIAVGAVSELGPVATTVGSIAFAILNPLTAPVLYVSEDDRRKLTQLHATAQKIHAYEMTRLNDIHTLARDWLGKLGEVGPYHPPIPSEELTEFEHEKSINHPLFALSVKKAYLQFRRVQDLREKMWSTQVSEIQSIADQIFTKIRALRTARKTLAEKLKTSETTDYTPTSAPLFTQPAGLRPEVHPIQLQSHFATLRDLQNLAIRVIEESGESVPNIQAALLQGQQELRAARVDSASNCETQAFNTLYLTATLALDKLKGDLDTLKKMDENQAKTQVMDDLKNTSLTLTEFLTRLT